jgi:ABC-type multidrug transport system ATPase subunit
LVSSHNLDDVADIATHIGILHEGRLAFSAPMNVIRERLGLVQFAISLPELPLPVKSQIVCSRSRDGVTQWLVADRDHSALQNFVDGMDRENVQWKPLTVKKLFLFLTSTGLVD